MRLQDHWLVKASAMDDPAMYNIECYCGSNWADANLRGKAHEAEWCS